MTSKLISKKQIDAFMSTMMSIDVVLNIIADIKTWVVFFIVTLNPFLLTSINFGFL